MKKGRAGKGLAHARYVQGEGRYGRDDVAFVEHGNMPAFAAADPLAFWAAADANERANGRAYAEVEFAIPRELETEKERIRFAQRFTDKLIGMDHAYTLAIHDKAAADGGRNVHAHLMFTERKNDGIERDAVQFFRRANPKAPEKGGAAKDRAFNNRQFVADTRTLYQTVVNRELEARGVAPISMARNDELEPEPKLGPAHPRVEHDARREARLEAVREIRAARAEARRIDREGPTLDSAILDLSNDLQAALAERERQQAASRVPSPAERLAMFRREVQREMAKELVQQAPKLGDAPRRATAVKPSPAQLKKESREAMQQELTARGYELWTSEVHIGRDMHVGLLLIVDDQHVAQDRGRKSAVIHDRALLTGPCEVGQIVKIQYRDGRASVEPKLAPGQAKARGQRI